jgi:hypothetical protein
MAALRTKAAKTLTSMVMGLALTTSVSTTAVAQQLEFMLINLSPANIEAFFVSAASSGHWEENLLEGSYLPPGHEIGVRIGDGLRTCIYDLRAVFSDGDELEDFGVDLCETGSFTYE